MRTSFVLSGLSLSSKVPMISGRRSRKNQNQPYASFREHFDKNTLFGGFARESLLGIVGFFALEGPEQSHKGVLWGMYVRPEVRGTGLATALVESLIEHARERVEQIQWTVVASNPRARRFYQRMDFLNMVSRRTHSNITAHTSTKF